MDMARLAKMANQIGDFFGSYPDREEAVRQVAQHLTHYWEPRMRREIVAHVRQTGGPELTEIARKAVLSLEGPPGTHSPT